MHCFAALTPCLVVVAFVSTIFFTILVLFSSFLTTTFLNFLEKGSVDEHLYSYSPYYLNPIDVFRDLVASTLSILNDELGIIDETAVSPTRASQLAKVVSNPSGPTARFLKRFLIGLPLVGMGSLIQMILSLPFLGPVQWIARFRRSRSRRDTGRDTTGIIILVLLLVGTARSVNLIVPFYGLLLTFLEGLD